MCSLSLVRFGLEGGRENMDLSPAITAVEDVLVRLLNSAREEWERDRNKDRQIEKGRDGQTDSHREDRERERERA